MKKLLLLSSVAGLLIFAAGCKKDKVENTTGGEAGLVVEKKQRGFVGYVGATWCPPCGTSGGPGYKAIMAKFTTDQMVSFYLAPSGETAPQYKDEAADQLNTAGFLSDLYGAMKSTGGIPFYNVNGSNVGGAYTDPNYTATIYGANITSLIANTPQIGVAAKATLTADKLSCDVKIKAFEEYTGDLYYSVIAVEKSVKGIQATSVWVTDYEHSNVARASLIGSGSWSGQKAFEVAASGTTAANKEFNKTFSFDYKSYAVTPGTTKTTVSRSTAPILWNYTPANTSIIVTIWSKIGANYAYVNGVVAK
jgi:hypothetical protein